MQLIAAKHIAETLGGSSLPAMLLILSTAKAIISAGIGCQAGLDAKRYLSSL